MEAWSKQVVAAAAAGRNIPHHYAQAEEPVTKNEKVFVMFPFTVSSVKSLQKKHKKTRVSLV